MLLSPVPLPGSESRNCTEVTLVSLTVPYLTVSSALDVQEPQN